jgi:hypothetical protein
MNLDTKLIIEMCKNFTFSEIQPLPKLIREYRIEELGNWYGIQTRFHSILRGGWYYLSPELYTTKEEAEAALLILKLSE